MNSPPGQTGNPQYRLPAPLRGYGACIGLVAILLLSGWLRFDNSGLVHSIDELWTLSAIDFMREHKTLDNNAANLYVKWWPGSQFDQYINSSYYTATYLLEAVMPQQLDNQEARFLQLRLFNVLLDLAGMIMVFFLAKRYASTGIALTTCLLYGILPFSVYDAHIIRLESFMNFLFIASIYVLYMFRASFLPIFFSALLCGAAIASKVNMLVFSGAIFAVYLLTFYRHQPIRKQCYACLVFTAGILIGIAATAPYIFIHFKNYIWGLQRLLYQYGLSAVPTGYIESSITAHLSRVIENYLYTTGPLFLVFCVAGIAAIISHKKNSFLALVLLLFIACIASVVAQNQYWTRNISHSHWMACLLCSIGFFYLYEQLKPSRAWIPVIAIITLAPMLFYSVAMKNSAFSAIESNRIKTAEASLLENYPDYAIKTPNAAGIYMLSAEPIAPDLILRIRLSNSDWDELYIHEMEKAGWVIIKKIKTPYFMLPVNDITSSFGAYYIYMKAANQRSSG